jgi:hypothetical protein
LVKAQCTQDRVWPFALCQKKPHPVWGAWASESDAAGRLKQGLFVLAGIAQRVGDDAAAVLDMVAGRMQVAVQPEPGTGQQVVERIAKPGGAGDPAVARVGTHQTGRKVGHEHGVAVKRFGQRLEQPVLAHQRLRPPRLGQPRTVRVPKAGLVGTGHAKPKAEEGNPNHVGAPMPGMVVTVAVKVGQKVK